MRRLVERQLLDRAVRWLAVALVAAGVAYVVTSVQTAEDADSTGIPSASRVDAEDRATVAMATVTIQPVLSGNGRVVPGEDEDTWVIEAPVAPVDQAYQLIDDPVGVKARILGGPSGFDCTWLPLGVGPDGTVTMRCQIPGDIPVVEGLEATMVVQLDEPEEVTALPVTAVVGSAEQGQVVVVTPGGMEVRTVELGRSDAFNVEIVSGLSSDSTVLAAPIQRDFTAAAS